MPKKENSPIKLQLEEAIWLDHRARDAEIVSLELIPDVDIVEDDHFVNIRGQLVLIGRIESDDEGESLDLESSSLADQLQFDPLHVEPKELYEQEYRGKIEHYFPFDVTVPANKIKRIEDIYVQVEQFDYTVTDGHRLQIKTEISITGIEHEVVEDSKQEEIKKEVKSETDVWSDFLPIGNNEAQEVVRVVNDEQGRNVNQEQAEDSQAEMSKLEISRKNDAWIETSTTQKAASLVQEDKEKVTEVNEEVAEKLESKERTDQVNSEQAEDSTHEVQAEAEIIAWEERDETFSAEKSFAALFPQEIKTTFSSRPELNESVSEVANDEEIVEEESVREEQVSRTVSFLTKLMEHGDEESVGSRKRKLRMCIIQQNESLEDIAERYSISVYELMKANRLETDHISKGQILYIPSM